MALDIKALLAKKKQIEAASNNAIWKPKAGANKVRIVPCMESPENPFQDLKFTYPDGKTTLSPETFDKPDPIAEFGRALRSEGQLSKEDWAVTKQYVPATRTYVTIIDRDDEKAGVKFWAISPTTFKRIVEIISNEEDYGDITDVKQGHDLIVTYTPKDKSATKFAQTDVDARPRKTPLSDDAAITKRWLTEQPKLLDQFPLLTYEELEKVLVAAVNKSKGRAEECFRCQGRRSSRQEALSGSECRFTFRLRQAVRRR
jgi:hypothetical protein